MRLGIVDLGTNSVRFDVVKLGEATQPQILHREKLMIRLGQDVFLNGRLAPSAIRRTLHAFLSFERTARELHVQRMIAFATSAVREADAQDVDRLLSLIHRRTGIEVKVISGEEEARLISQGVLSRETLPKKRFALVDIGGGSTEVSVCRDKKALHQASFRLGTARLQQMHLKTSPPRREAVVTLREFIRESLLGKKEADHWPKKVDRVLGSSGTVRILVRVLRKSKKPLDRNSLRALVKKMSAMSSAELLGIPGMEPKRVDMILAGAILFEECLTALGCKKFQWTGYALRDGILEEEVRLAKLHTRSRISVHLPDFYATAERIGCDEAHFRQVVALSLRLFDELAPLHRLKKEWRGYLEAASVLHDSGESISAVHHGVHSYYVAKNADFPTIEPWESELIAQLCLHHVGHKWDKKMLSVFSGKQVCKAFPVLLSILRVADALDRGYRGKIELKSVRRTRKQVELHIAGKRSFDLEVLRVEEKKALFEQVFAKKLVVVTH